MGKEHYRPRDKQKEQQEQGTLYGTDFFCDPDPSLAA